MRQWQKEQEKKNPHQEDTRTNATVVWGISWGCTECPFNYLIGHDSLLGSVSSSPLLGTVEVRVNNVKSAIRYRKYSKHGAGKQMALNQTWRKSLVKLHGIICIYNITRATSNDYFSLSINLHIIFLINRLVHNISENVQKLLEAQGDVFKLLIYPIKSVNLRDIPFVLTYDKIGGKQTNERLELECLVFLFEKGVND